MRHRLFAWIRERFTPAPPPLALAPQAPVAIVPQAPAPSVPLPPRVVMPPAPRPAAPPPPKFNSAVELLQQQPYLTAAELVQRAGITMSYARRLIRQQQLKAAASAHRAPKAEAPANLAAAGPAPVRKWTRPAQEIPVQPMLLSPRTQVLERSASGVALKTIAEDLKLPQDEVDFIAKIGRIKNTLKN